MRNGMSYVMSAVEPSWRRAPFTPQRSRTPGAGSRSVSIQGPTGQNVSNPLPLVNCGSLRVDHGR